jgi:uncharacterized damage-inducible protein DinB
MDDKTFHIGPSNPATTLTTLQPMSPERSWWPPRNGDEKSILESYLKWYREGLLEKVEGLSDADMKRRLVASETTLFGIVHHLAYVERWWFQDVFDGRSVEYPWTDDDSDAEWHTEGSITSDEAIALYKQECDISRQIAAAANPDDFAKHEKFQDMMLRRVMVHMIEETARHLGHADILRELIDGTTGQ